MKLYELHREFAHLEELLETAENPDVIRETLDSIEALAEDKALNIVWLMKGLESEVEMFKTEEARLAARRKTKENRMQGLKEYLHLCISQSGKDKIKAGTFTIGLQKSAPSVFVTDAALVPADYKTVVVQENLDRTRILQALKAGEAVPGVSLNDENYHVRIR